MWVWGLVRMPIEYEIFPDINLALFQYRGRFVSGVLVSGLQALTRDRRYASGLYLIGDMSQCDFGSTRFSHMQDLMYRLEDHLASRATTARTFLFAPGDVTFGMMRMFQMLAEDRSNHEMNVFREFDDGLVFLGVDPTAAIAAELRLRVGTHKFRRYG